MLSEEFSYFCNAPSTIECLIGILHRCFQKERSGIKLPELKESAESVPPIRPARQPLVEHQWLRQFFRHCGELSPTTSRYSLNKKSLLEIRYSSFHSIISLNGICFLILRNNSIFSACFLMLFFVTSLRCQFGSCPNTNPWIKLLCARLAYDWDINYWIRSQFNPS